MIQYLPQDEICYRCEHRIGDHDEHQLWVCLEKTGGTFKEYREIIKQLHEKSKV